MLQIWYPLSDVIIVDGDKLRSVVVWRYLSFIVMNFHNKTNSEYIFYYSL